jgi:hypothetical protein
MSWCGFQPILINQIIDDLALVNVLNGPEQPQDVDDLIKYKANERPCKHISFRHTQDNSENMDRSLVPKTCVA